MGLIFCCILLWCVVAVPNIFEKRTLTTGYTKEAVLPVRGILAIGIVAHHCLKNYNGDIFHQFYELGVPIVSIFFFISGYGLYRTLEIKGSRYLDGFLKRSMKKLLPLFILVNIIAIFLKLISHSVTIPGLLVDMSHGLLPQSNTWFVIALIVLYIFFYISNKLVPNKLWSTTIILCLSILTIMLTNNILHWGGVLVVFTVGILEWLRIPMHRTAYFTKCR